MARIIRRAFTAKVKLGLSESSFDDLRRNDPSFPLPVALGARSIGFIEAEVDRWIESRPRIGATEQSGANPAEAVTP